MNRNSVIAGSLTLILTVGVVGWTSSRLNEGEGADKILVFDCSIQKDSVRISFDTNMKVEFALAEECGKSLRRAIDEGQVGLREAMGIVDINLYFSDAFAGRVSIDQALDTSKYLATIPNDVFWTYANMNEGRAAEEVRVELNYVSSLQESPLEIVSQAIPKSTPKLTIEGDGQCHLYEDDGTYAYSVVFVRYASYQVADSVEFDWPGEDSGAQGNLENCPEIQGISYVGWFASNLGSFFPSGTVVVRAEQDGKTVQSLNVDYERSLPSN